MTDVPRIAAGFDYLYYFTLDSNGRIKGNTAVGATNGTIQGARWLEGGRTIPFVINEDETITVTGNNKPLVSFSFPSAELPSGVLETAVKNMGFDALVQGTKVRNVADLAFSGRGSGESSRPDMGLLALRQAKKWTEGNRGTSAWEGQLALKTNITPLGSNITERQFDPYRYSINLSGSDRYSWGATFTEAADGFTNKPIIDIEGDNPVHLMGGYGDGVTVAFALDYTPKTAAKMIVTLDGVLKALTTHYTLSGKTLTFGVAPGSGVHIGIIYEVDAADFG
jgi:hypothetical protein